MIDRPFTVVAVAVELPLVNVKAAKLLEPVKELSANVKASVAVLVEVMEEVPEVAVRLRAPVERVNPLEAVSVLATDSVPVKAADELMV